MQLNDPSKAQTDHWVFRIPHQHKFLHFGKLWMLKVCKLEILQLSDVQEFQIMGMQIKRIIVRSWQNWNSHWAKNGFSLIVVPTKNFSVSFFLIDKVFCLLMRQRQINRRGCNIYYKFFSWHYHEHNVLLEKKWILESGNSQIWRIHKLYMYFSTVVIRVA